MTNPNVPARQTEQTLPEKARPQQNSGAIAKIGEFLRHPLGFAIGTFSIAYPVMVGLSQIGVLERGDHSPNPNGVMRKVDPEELKSRPNLIPRDLAAPSMHEATQTTELTQEELRRRMIDFLKRHSGSGNCDTQSPSYNLNGNGLDSRSRLSLDDTLDVSLDDLIITQ